MPTRPDEALGPLALIGGDEWRDGPAFNEILLSHADGEVVIVPTAAAYEHPEQSVAQATAHFGRVGATVRSAMVLNRRDAESRALADVVRSARFLYLCGGSPLHLRSVLKDSAVLAALVAAWHDGAVIAGSGAGAMALSDPMVDPRGGAFTVGLGLVRAMSVVPHFDGNFTASLTRTLALSPAGCALVALGEATALIREPDGTWHTDGPGPVAVYVDDAAVGLEALAGKSVWERPVSQPR